MMHVSVVFKKKKFKIASGTFEFMTSGKVKWEEKKKLTGELNMT